LSSSRPNKVLAQKITSLRAIWEEKPYLRLDFPRRRGLRYFSCSVPKWWNWQTRHLEGVVGKPVRVQIPPSAPSQ
jgi:hypothetical protein